MFQIKEAKRLFKLGRKVTDIAAELHMPERVVRKHVYGATATSINELPIILAGYYVDAFKEKGKSSIRVPMDPQPNFTYQGTAKVRYEPHPFMSRAPFGLGEHMSWVAYDWVENPVGVELADWFSPPLGLPNMVLHVHQVCSHDLGTWDDDPNASLRADLIDIDRATPTDIKLRLTHVRMERLQDITNHDICEEGVMTSEVKTTSGSHTPSLREMMECVWDIEHKGTEFAWDKNPWVLVYDFEVLT